MRLEYRVEVVRTGRQWMAYVVLLVLENQGVSSASAVYETGYHTCQEDCESEALSHIEFLGRSVG